VAARCCKGVHGTWDTLEQNEVQLVERMREGDQRAFDQFFERFAPRIASFASRRCSLDDSSLEDVVQVTLISAVRGLSGFRGTSSLFTWLCRICRNHLADLARSSARKPREMSLEKLVDEGTSADRAVVAETRDLPDEGCDAPSRHAISRTIDSLPELQARILELRYGEELTVPAIARELGISVNAAELRLSRARRAFRRRWANRSRTQPIGATRGRRR